MLDVLFSSYEQKSHVSVIYSMDSIVQIKIKYLYFLNFCTTYREINNDHAIAVEKLSRLFTHNHHETMSVGILYKRNYPFFLHILYLFTATYDRYCENDAVLRFIWHRLCRLIIAQHA